MNRDKDVLLCTLRVGQRKTRNQDKHGFGIVGMKTLKQANGLKLDLYVMLSCQMYTDLKPMFMWITSISVLNEQSFYGSNSNFVWR